MLLEGSSVPATVLSTGHNQPAKQTQPRSMELAEELGRLALHKGGCVSKSRCTTVKEEAERDALWRVSCPKRLTTSPAQCMPPLHHLATHTESWNASLQIHLMRVAGEGQEQQPADGLACCSGRKRRMGLRGPWGLWGDGGGDVYGLVTERQLR